MSNEKKQPKLIEFDCNGDMTVLIDGKPVRLTITVGQVERMQALIDAQTKDAKEAREQRPDDGPEAWMVQMVRSDYQALDVILNPDLEKPKFPADDLTEKIPVNHARQIVKKWLHHMLFNPGAPKDPQ